MGSDPLDKTGAAFFAQRMGCNKRARRREGFVVCAKPRLLVRRRPRKSLLARPIWFDGCCHHFHRNAALERGQDLVDDLAAHSVEVDRGRADVGRRMQ